MNIKQNIVRIKTSNQIGSGIIYPCESDINEFDITKYIIFTNRHIINDLKDVVDEDLNKVLDIDIYDNNGNLINIDDREYVDLKLFIPDNANDDMKEDIAAILITFKYKLELNLVKKIMFNDNDIDDLCVEGFPQVLFNNDISSKIELKGKYKEIFPKNRKFGIFQITDDYHWYSNYKDLRLFQGFSGGPIYKKTDNETYLVGLNQSLFNLNEGENPFKLLYYYKFYFVLEYLREKGGIIFKRNQDSSVTIRWKAQTNKNISSGENIEKKEEGLTLEKFFLSSLDFGDLDTSSINILLLGASGAGKSSFVKTFLLHKDCIDSVNDGQTTRTNVVYKLSLFNQTPHAIVHFLDSSQFKKFLKELFYEKYLLKAMSAIEKKEFKDIDVCKEVESVNEILDNNQKIETDKSKKELLIQSIEQHIEKNINMLDAVFYKKTFFDLFSSSSGMFSYKEFEFLKLKKLNCFFKEIIDKEEEIQGNRYKYYFDECCKKFYKEIQSKLITNNKISNIVKFQYNELHKGLNIEEIVSMEIELNDSIDTIDLLSKCLQQKNNLSLTGIINYVEIFDCISNEYAFILDDLEIDILTIIDSVGIDHENYYTEGESVLSKNLDKLIENNLISFKSDSAVIYLKKLDAGKPTELKNVIPLIFNKVPQSPVYCVFNGLDIYLGSKVREFKGFSYMCAKPKSVQYLEKAEKEIISELKNDTYFSKSLYDTLKNNISCFCSDEDIVNNNFNIYHYNRKVVYDLLLSICMKEYSCINIIPINNIEFIQNVIISDDFRKEIEKLFMEVYDDYKFGESFFVDGLNKHINKIKVKEDKEAQILEERIDLIKSIKESIEVVIKKYYLYFSVTFKTYVSKKKDLLSLSKNPDFKKYIPSIDSCVKNMQDYFVVFLIVTIFVEKGFFGDDTFSVKRKPFENISDFKKFCESYFIDMWKNKLENKGFYSDLSKFLKELKKRTRYVSFKKWCEDTFNYFLIYMIKKDNKFKSENLMKINYEFYKQFLEIKQGFEKKYKNVNFNEVLEYYVSDKVMR